MTDKIAAFRARKGGTPLVCLTAYTAPMARILDAHADLLLVGDSVAMVLYGMSTTVGISLETMIGHGQAVCRAAERAVVIVDLPAGSYEESPEQALVAARRVMDETGCDGVKFEGGTAVAPAIAAITQAGIPVMAHIGLLPQAVAETGYRVQGKTEEDAQRILDDARAVAAAGAFGVVIECTLEPVAAAVTKEVDIPVIGIGGSASCDGQILVTDDMLGMTAGKLPRFVKRYADLPAAIDEAAARYAEEVRARSFPAREHLYFPKSD